MQVNNKATEAYNSANMAQSTASSAGYSASVALAKTEQVETAIGDIDTAISDIDERVKTLENEGGTPIEGAVLYTEQTLTEEQKAQARENIGAVAEDETFDRAIGEVIVGKNLLNINAPAPDPSDPYSGGFWRKNRFYDDGTIGTIADSCITDFILVKQGSFLVFSSNFTGERGGMMGRRVIGYDENKNFVKLVVSSKNYASASQLNGIAYVRIQFTTTYVDADGQVEYGASGTAYTDYEPYTETVVPGGYTLKPECMPAEFGELTERVAELENIGGGEGETSTLAIDKARFDSQFNYVAYSDINGIGKDQNSREFFLWAAKKPFNSLKGDVRITSDGKLVMLHDKGFTFDDEGKATQSNSGTAIRDMTEAECLAVQFARYSGYVCSFDEYIRICKKYGKIAYCTIRDEFMDEVVPEMMRILRKYGMVQRCIINSFTYSSLRAVRAADPNIMLSQVLAQNAGVDTAAIDRAVALGNMMICGFDFSTSTTVDAVASKIDTSVMEYAAAKDIRVYQAQVNSMEVADKLLEYGITGAQIRFNLSFE